MADPVLTLYGSGTSRTLRTLWLAHEMGLDFRHIPVGPRTGETRTPEFLVLNPRHKVPIIQYGEVVLTESAAIMIFLTETFPVPDHVFVGGKPAERARHLEWCFFIMSELDANGLYTMRRHGDLKAIYGDAPVAVKGGGDYFLYQLERMEEPLRAASPFLMGERISPADVLFASCLDWALKYDLRLPRHLIEYHEMMTARPAYLTAEAQNDG